MAYVSATRYAKVHGVNRTVLNIARYVKKLDVITLKSGRKLYWVDDDILEAYKRRVKRNILRARRRRRTYMEGKNGD